jgi:hypothetical protein
MPTIPNQDREADVEVDVTLNNTVLYNGMIHPLTRMVIKGVIWYQGISLMETMSITYYDFR